MRIHLGSAVVAAGLLLAAAGRGAAVPGAALGEAMLSAGAEAAAGEAAEDPVYDRGIQALDSQQWSRAVELFREASKKPGANADGALYWQAYALNKLGQRTEAASTLDALRKSFPKSRWLEDAGALDLEIRQAAGQRVAPESEPDEDLKILAINSLIQSEPERALPLLEKILDGNQSLKVKERALFVLSQSNSARAREIVAKVAGGSAGRELQMKALRDLGIFGGAESRQELAKVYASSTDENVKKAILQSFMVAGERERLLDVAKGEKSPELRGQAVQLLGAMGAQAELGQLYQTTSDPDFRKKIMRGIFVGGNTTKLLEIARNDKDPELRREAIRWLGRSGSKESGALASIYASEPDKTIRKQVIDSMFIQDDARGLVEIARQEKDPDLKKAAVDKLSRMRSKEAADYMMEILNK